MGEAKTFLEEVKKRFKEGNAPMYAQAIKNLETHLNGIHYRDKNSEVILYYIHIDYDRRFMGKC